MNRGILIALAVIILVVAISLISTYGVENVLLGVGVIIALGVGAKIHQYMNRF